MLTFSCCMQYLTHHGVKAEILTLPTSEPNKSFNLVFKVAEKMDAFGLNRCSPAASAVLRFHRLSLSILWHQRCLEHTLMLLQAQGAYHCHWWRRLPGCLRAGGEPVPSQHAYHQGAHHSDGCRGCLGRHQDRRQVRFRPSILFHTALAYTHGPSRSVMGAVTLPSLRLSLVMTSSTWNDLADLAPVLM